VAAFFYTALIEGDVFKPEAEFPPLGEIPAKARRRVAQ
jgi:hypothetical protein